MSKSFIKSFLTGATKHQRKGWTVKYANPNNSKKIFRGKLNTESIALFRFADDCRIFANSKQVIETILTKINEFLAPRGLEVNLSKTKIKYLHEFEKFNFVEFEFAIRRTHGAWKIYNFPPKSKIVPLKQKVDHILKSYKSKPYIVFYLVNSVVRG